MGKSKAKVARIEAARARDSEYPNEAMDTGEPANDSIPWHDVFGDSDYEAPTLMKENWAAHGWTREEVLESLDALHLRVDDQRQVQRVLSEGGVDPMDVSEPSAAQDTGRPADTGATGSAPSQSCYPLVMFGDVMRWFPLVKDRKLLPTHRRMLSSL